VNFREIEELLPNGFHDAYLQNVKINFQDRSVILNLKVLMATEDRQTSHPRYEDRILRFDGVSIAHFDPSFSFFDSKNPNGLQMDSTEVRQTDIDKFACEGHRALQDSFWCGFFIFESNAIIIVNAQRASLSNKA
jgi:hypothetical protein